MKITAIKSQVKQVGRYSLFVDGKYSFSLSEAALIDRKLHLDQELSAKDVTELKQVSSDDKLLGMALRYASLRPRSTWEMEQYLQRKKASPPLTDEILNKLSKYDMLNDTTFAQAWVSTRRLLKPVSRRRLQAELRAKRVSDDVISSVLLADETDDLTTLHDLIERKQRQTKYQDSTKLMQYLARQGYNYDDIKTALHANT